MFLYLIFNYKIKVIGMSQYHNEGMQIKYDIFCTKTTKQTRFSKSSYQQYLDSCEKNKREYFTQILFIIIFDTFEG